MGLRLVLCLLGYTQFALSLPMLRVPEATSLKPVEASKTILSTRDFKAAAGMAPGITESSSKHLIENVELDLNKTALVLIDVWKHHSNWGWSQRAKKHMQEKLVPLVELARRYGIQIIHSPHGKPIADVVKPKPGEYVIHPNRPDDFENQLEKFLKKKGITHLLYAGYSANWCIMFRQTGVIKFGNKGYRIILVRDGTIGFETPESLEGQWGHKIAVNMVEANWWGSSTTLKDLYRAIVPAAPEQKRDSLDLAMKTRGEDIEAN